MPPPPPVRHVRYLRGTWRAWKSREVEPGEFDLVAEPAGETGLPQRAKPVRAESGFRVREDFVFGTGRVLKGRVVDADGKGVYHATVVAVPAEAYDEAAARGDVTWEALRSVPKESDATDPAGVFAIRGLALDETHRIVLHSDRWLHA